MATNELTARVTLQGEIKANATLGVPVEVYVDREIYDGETEITPTEDDITLETAGKAVLDDILIHGVPTDPNVYEGEFEGTETGVLTIDTGYEGDSYPKMLVIYPASGTLQEDFLSETLKYSINTICGIKDKHAMPTYEEGEASDKMRVLISYNYGTVYASQAALYIYYAQDEPRYSGGLCVRIVDKRTIKMFVSDVQSGGSVFIPTGVKFKYQVFY